MMSCSHVGVQCTADTDFQDPVVPLQPGAHLSSVLCASCLPLQTVGTDTLGISFFCNRWNR